ncbi:hypothetical protein [Litoribacillus peritrichatus]|uniref:Transglutaminase-like domain-containing protein n=1 Tax=Litoribacillus peritrichatus TaxID=718191 RepID=A0ABP7MXR6_9GAMM
MNKTKLIALFSALPLAVAITSAIEAKTYSDEFLQWKQQTMTSYQQYKDERDKAFTDFLKKQWKEVDTEEGVVRDATPKPVDMPIAKPKPVKIKEPLPVVKLPETVKPLPPKPVVTAPTTDIPVVSMPVDKKPQKERPVFDQPLADLPKIDLPDVSQPELKKPETEKPIIEQPKLDQPVVKQPVIIEEPKIQKPTIEQPVIEQPVIEKPVIEKPVAEQPKKPITTPIVIADPKKKPLPKYSGVKHTFNFFGRKTTIYADRKLSKGLGHKYNSKTIADGWSNLSLTDYEPVLEQLSHIANTHNLGDWGKVQLAFALTKKLYPSNINNQSFATWFLLIKQDYQARLAYNDKGVYLLIPANESLYEVTFFTFGGKRFYAVSPDGKSKDLGRVFTYDGEYPRAVEPVSMKDNLAFSDETNYKQRSFKFSFDKRQHRITLNVNPSRVNYLASYPQMDIDQYFVSPVDTVTANDALAHFRPLLEGKTELEAVNMLLRFVQTGFEYQTDDQQFGYENYLFAEETLTMPASDCEDRSVLFAWLVRELLGLEVVGLDYPGHIAAAVHFSKPVPGDKVAWNGKDYTVTDPTYINANSGMTMPEVAAHKPKVVAIQ